jgi:hypothetical protein
MTLPRINARALLKYSPEHLWNNLKGNFILVFDDGEMQTNHAKTNYSRHLWKLHNIFPKTPLLKKHHVGYYTQTNPIDTKTHIKLYETLAWDVRDTYREIDPKVSLDVITSLIYDINSELYNAVISNLGQYLTSIDIKDFIEIVDYPEIKESQLVLQDEPKSNDVLRNQKIIDDVTKVVKEVLNSPTKLPHNQIVKAVRSKLVRAEQAYQCVGVRGYLTRDDSFIFRYPIMTGWVRGINKIYDAVIEAQSASKALSFTKDPLQDSEYFSRRLQQLLMTLKNLYRGDCGSTHYFKWKVRPGTDGSSTEGARKPDLEIINGKYYLCEETNTLKVIKKTDKHLVGKTLKLRSPLGGCMHTSHYGICEVCYGTMSDNIPPNTNLGQANGTMVCEKTSQAVMSVKHYDGSSKVDPIIISEEDSAFIVASKDNGSYFFAPELKGKTIKLHIPVSEAPGFADDIADCDNVSELSLSNITEMDSVTMLVMEEDYYVEAVLPVSVGRRKASLSYYILEKAKEAGWEIKEIEGKQVYVIEIKNCDIKRPFLALPFRHVNMGDYSDTISKIIESRVSDLKKRDGQASVEATLLELFDVINTKLNINLAVVEVILYGAMIVSAEDRDYRYPKPWTKQGLGVTSLTIPNRSLSAAMAFQDHKAVLSSPSNFSHRNRPSHPMDVLLCPQEVVDHKNKQIALYGRREPTAYENVMLAASLSNGVV